MGPDEIDIGYIESPIGLIEIGGTRAGITSLRFVTERQTGCVTSPLVDEAIRQISEYFKKSRRAFDVPLALDGTRFQHSVWRRLLDVPYGRVVSYGSIARAIGKPTAVRAVGAANGRNPVSIIVPCHRIVGSDGSLTGYGGGLRRKEWLLQHEGVPMKKVGPDRDENRREPPFFHE